MTALNGFPTQTTAAQGMFAGPSSNGMIQGQADPDPSTRFALRSAIVDGNETLPMFGGLGVFALLSPTTANGPRSVLGQSVGRATSLTGSKALIGFSVFDQAYNMVNDPQNPVPTAGSGQSINYYPLGCRARIAVAASPALVALQGDLINTRVSWDFVAQELVPYAPAYTNVTITDAVWANTSGGETTFTVTTDLTAVLSAGDVIDVQGVESTGSSVGFNGNFSVLSVTSTEVVVSQPLSGSPGTYASGGTIVGGGGALPVTVLEVQPSNCMTVQSVGGAYQYNFNGACAKIQLTGGTTA